MASAFIHRREIFRNVSQYSNEGSVENVLFYLRMPSFFGGRREPESKDMISRNKKIDRNHEEFIFFFHKPMHILLRNQQSCDQ